eukprot:6187855-Pleurochrysis_carterae.AAC.1
MGGAHASMGGIWRQARVRRKASPMDGRYFAHPWAKYLVIEKLARSQAMLRTQSSCTGINEHFSAVDARTRMQVKAHARARAPAPTRTYPRPFSVR